MLFFGFVISALGRLLEMSSPGEAGGRMLGAALVCWRAYTSRGNREQKRLTFTGLFAARCAPRRAVPGQDQQGIGLSAFAAVCLSFTPSFRSSLASRQPIV